MLKKFIKKHWPLILLIIIAAFLRLYKIASYTEFLGDQGRDVIIIREFLKNGNLFFIGPQTSIGNMYLGPYFYYLIAPALLLSRFSPVGPAIFIALLSVATVWLIYFVAKSWFNKSVALISAFLFAISPVVIKYSSFIWNPNIMPFFALLFIYFFFKAFEKEKYVFFTYAILAFIMTINSHYLALALLPLPGLYWLIYLIKYIKTKSKKLKPFLLHTSIAFFVFLVSLTPQILFDIKHNGQNIKALLTFFTKRETTINIKAYKAIPELPALFTQVNTRLLAGKIENIGVIITVTFTLLLLLFFIKEFKKIKKKDLLKNKFFVIFLWYLSGLVALALYKHHIYDHYFAFLFPAVFMLIAFLINKIKVIGIPLLVLIIVFSFVGSPFRHQPNNQLKTTQEVANSIISSANNQDFNYSVLSKMGWGFSYYLTDNENYFEIKDKLTEQLFVVCVPFQMDCNPINNPEWGIAAFGWAKIDSQWEIDGIQVFKLVHNPDGQKQK